MKETSKKLLNIKNKEDIIKSKKNAFTLIELLAIIVILAIIAVITVPIILNIIENSKKGAATDSAYGYKDAVNKYYVTELSKPENRELILQGEYTVKANGVLDGSGISNKEIPVSGDKPLSGKLHYTNNVLDDGCLVIGDYKITFKSDGSVNETAKGNCDDYVISSGNDNAASHLTIGTDVNYVTSLNNVSLDDWKVFYVDGDYTYLIYGDYLPNAAVNTTGTNVNKAQNYSFYSSDREQLINLMTTKSNWDNLLTGTINDIPVNEERTANVWAMGSPTIELWIASWNSANVNDKLYTATTDTTMSDGLIGYYIGSSPNPAQVSDNLYAYVSNSNTLYFPHDSWFDGSVNDGYYLASPSASTDLDRMRVDSSGMIGSGWYQEGYEALRPVIKLPTSVVNQ